METKLHLNDGEYLRKTGQRSKGPLAETDINFYEIINAVGVVVGSVEYTDHTSINGLRRTQHVIQRDINGEKVVEEHW